MAKLLWRVKLVAEPETGVISETAVARIERDDDAGPETVGLTLAEGKQLTAAVQAQTVRAQVAAMGERFRWCGTAGRSCWARAATPPHFALCPGT